MRLIYVKPQIWVAGKNANRPSRGRRIERLSQYAKAVARYKVKKKVLDFYFIISLK